MTTYQLNTELKYFLIIAPGEELDTFKQKILTVTESKGEFSLMLYSNQINHYISVVRLIFLSIKITGKMRIEYLAIDHLVKSSIFHSLVPNSESIL